MGSETDIRVAIRPQSRSHFRWEPISKLAERQHGTIGRFQLLDLGFSSEAIGRLVRSGRLIVIHRGVYAVGHRKLSVQGWRMGAVLFGGPGAVLSHRPAGAEWTLRSWSGKSAITVPPWRRSIPAIEIHSASLPADEVTISDGIPITTVPRTLLDLATVLDRHALLRAVNVAEARQLSDPLSLPALLDRHCGERGTAKLRTVLGDGGYGMGVTDEELEERFARFISERHLPHPSLNASIQVGDVFYRADCLWPNARLIVELHSAKWHGTKPAITRDATRDRRLLLAGWNVIHVTWAQLRDRREADALERDLRVALQLGGNPASGFSR